jgi:hypothetical protein
LRGGKHVLEKSLVMGKAVDFRDKVTGFLQTALHELHQAAMFARGNTYSDVRRLIRTAESLKERVAKEAADDLVQERKNAQQKAAENQARKSAADANRLKRRKSPG